MVAFERQNFIVYVGIAHKASMFTRKHVPLIISNAFNAIDKSTNINRKLITINSLGPILLDL